MARVEQDFFVVSEGRHLLEDLLEGAIIERRRDLNDGGHLSSHPEPFVADAPQDRLREGKGLSTDHFRLTCPRRWVARPVAPRWRRFRPAARWAAEIASSKLSPARRREK